MEIVVLLNCTLAQLLIIYLGLPMSYNKPTEAMLQPSKDTFAKNTMGWQPRLMSKEVSPNEHNAHGSTDLLDDDHGDPIMDETFLWKGKHKSMVATATLPYSMRQDFYVDSIWEDSDQGLETVQPCAPLPWPHGGGGTGRFTPRPILQPTLDSAFQSCLQWLSWITIGDRNNTDF
uniref:Uncharacterized protein n=1 Tax=Oryza punctata TaxID=4537 RepID=A0A0E0JZM1_ORYPU